MCHLFGSLSIKLESEVWPIKHNVFNYKVNLMLHNLWVLTWCVWSTKKASAVNFYSLKLIGCAREGPKTAHNVNSNKRSSPNFQINNS